MHLISRIAVFVLLILSFAFSLYALDNKQQWRIDVAPSVLSSLAPAPIQKN